MEKVRVRRKPMSEINVVPYIDVMLVLLVVFMITAPMLTQGIRVDLPNVDTKPISVKNEEPLIVSIKKDESYYINLGKKKDSATTLEDITKKVETVVKHNPGVMVLVEGDSSVAYGSVVALMGALQLAGVDNVGLITEPAEQRR